MLFRNRRRSFAAVLVALAATASSWMGAAPASAEPPPNPITDYANYPSGIVPAIIPDGCAPPFVTGLLFSAGGDSSSNLANLSLEPGEVVDMSWTGFSTGCENLGLSLALKRADGPTFDPTTNQELVTFDYCGPGGDTCVAGNDGRFHLTFTMRPRTDVCNWQVDSIIGPPLAVVGPGGSFYTDSARGDNQPSTLLSANNGGLVDDCGSSAPAASAELSCVEGGVVVTLSNTGDLAAAFVVTADDISVFDDEVAGGGSDSVTIPVTESDTVSVTVASGDTTLLDEDFTQDCFTAAVPGATATPQCASGVTGALITLTNTGQETATVEITRNGTVVESGPVASGETVTRTYAMAEDETATFRATTTGGFDSGPLAVTANCQQVQGTQFDQGAQTLARTGLDDTGTLAGLGAALIAAGALFLLAASRLCGDGSANPQLSTAQTPRVMFGGWGWVGLPAWAEQPSSPGELGHSAWAVRPILRDFRFLLRSVTGTRLSASNPEAEGQAGPNRRRGS